MTFVYFAHEPDQKLLEQSARNLRRLYGSPRIVVYWEEGKEGFLEGAENKVSTFKRNGNLHGLECVRGIIDCMLETNDHRVVKIDCDTILTRRLDDFENYHFYESVLGFLGVGCCYAIDQPMLLKLKKLFAEYKGFGGCHYCEDITISAACLYTDRGTLKLWYKGQVTGYDYSQDWDRYSKAEMIHMGNPDLKCDPRIKKARDAAHMKFFVDYLEANGGEV